MSSPPRAFNEIPSSALRTAILGAVLSSLAERAVNERAMAAATPGRREGTEDDGEIDIKVVGLSRDKRLDGLLATLFGPPCDDPSCEACMAQRASRGAAAKAPTSATVVAQRALVQATKALADATAAVEGAAKALALATSERA